MILQSRLYLLRIQKPIQQKVINPHTHIAMMKARQSRVKEETLIQLFTGTSASVHKTSKRKQAQAISKRQEKRYGKENNRSSHNTLKIVSMRPMAL